MGLATCPLCSALAYCAAAGSKDEIIRSLFGTWCIRIRELRSCSTGWYWNKKSSLECTSLVPTRKVRTRGGCIGSPHSQSCFCSRASAAGELRTCLQGSPRIPGRLHYAQIVKRRLLREACPVCTIVKCCRLPGGVFRSADLHGTTFTEYEHCLPDCAFQLLRH